MFDEMPSWELWAETYFHSFFFLVLLMPQSLEYIHPCVTPTHLSSFRKLWLISFRNIGGGHTSFLCFNKIPSPSCKFLPPFFPFFIGFPFVIFPCPLFDSFVFHHAFSVLGVYFPPFNPFLVLNFCLYFFLYFSSGFPLGRLLVDGGVLN